MEKKLSSIEVRIKRQQAKLIEFLAESGNVSFACKRAGVSRDTYYRWRYEDEFAVQADIAIALGKEFVNDLAHSQLIRNIQNGDMGAIKFQLGNCHDDYLPKKSVQAYRASDQYQPNIIQLHAITEQVINEYLKREILPEPLVDSKKSLGDDN